MKLKLFIVGVLMLARFSPAQLANNYEIRSNSPVSVLSYYPNNSTQINIASVRSDLSFDYSNVSKPIFFL